MSKLIPGIITYTTNFSNFLRFRIFGKFYKNYFSRLTVVNKEPEIFKYFGIFDEDDEQINEFEKNLEKRKSRYKMRTIDL